jgi:hypothetical protein
VAVFCVAFFFSGPKREMGVEGNDAAQGDASIVFHQPTNYCCFTRWLGNIVIEWLTLTFAHWLAARGCFDTRWTADCFTGNVVAVVERSGGGWTSVIAPMTMTGLLTE